MDKLLHFWFICCRRTTETETSGGEELLNLIILYVFLINTISCSLYLKIRRFYARKFFETQRIYQITCTNCHIFVDLFLGCYCGESSVWSDTSRECWLWGKKTKINLYRLCEFAWRIKKEGTQSPSVPFIRSRGSGNLDFPSYFCLEWRRSIQKRAGVQSSIR